MAIAVSIDLQFTASQVKLVDQTGSYDALSNPGGYGAPNPAFADYAHYAILRKKNVNSVADSILVLDAYDPLTATSFPATRSVDGWYKATKLNILIWVAGSYNNGDTRYRNGSIWKANATTSSIPDADGTWDLVTDLTTLESTSDPTLVVTTQNRNTPFNADAYWSSQIADLTEQGSLAINIDDRQKDRLDLIRQTVQQVNVADKRGNNTAGEWCSIRLIRLGAK